MKMLIMIDIVWIRNKRLNIALLQEHQLNVTGRGKEKKRQENWNSKKKTVIVIDRLI